MNKVERVEVEAGYSKMVATEEHMAGHEIRARIQAAMLGLLTIADTTLLLYVVGIGFGLGYGGIFPVYAVIVREYMPPEEAGRREEEGEKRPDCPPRGHPSGKP